MNKSQSKDIVLLLTACVSPKKQPNCVLLNAEIRKKQYLETILYYIKNTSQKIVFVDNSGYDISKDIEPVLATNRDRIEILSFIAPEYDPILGKGYGEMYIIKYALIHSNFINENTYIVKLTGRIILKNINNHIFFIKPNHIYGSLTYDFSSIGTVMVGAPLSFFYSLIKNHNLINDSKKHYFEHVFLYTICQIQKERQKCFQQSIIPFSFRGIAGSNGHEIKGCYFIELIKNIIKYMKLILGFKLNPVISIL